MESSKSPLITLTTDFEEAEPFVAILKGILYTRCPGAQVVDLGHNIPRGDVMAGALFVAAAIPAFPPGTVHLVHVGPSPESIALRVSGQSVVCADNGIVTLLLEQERVEEIRRIEATRDVQSEDQVLLHSREVVAPAAARLANGEALQALGPPLEEIVRLPVARPVKKGDSILVGEIMHIDRFGNLMSNIHRSDLEGLRVTRVDVGGFPINSVANSYTAVPLGKPLALVGSSGYLEVAYNGDRASDRLQMGEGIVFHAMVEPR